jgi:hypothetical protein
MLYKSQWEHLNESSQARNWSFEAGGRRQKKKAEGRNPKKCFYKYEMLPSQLMILYHSPLAETR